jgi:tRNA (adenine-N(1)-)-methyltransferase non-catalytic subunit
MCCQVTGIQERERRRREREERYATAEKLLRQKRMDGLVLACRFHPEPLLTALLGLLAPSRPVVVYCHLLEPLIDCYKTLKQKEDVVFDVEISETWTRYYQVLPERTHPSMTMDGHGGYLLTALTVQKSGHLHVATPDRSS